MWFFFSQIQILYVCVSSVDYMDTLQRILFEEVVVDPGPFQELMDKVEVPENLNAGFERPDTNKAIALPWSWFVQ